MSAFNRPFSHVIPASLSYPKTEKSLFFALEIQSNLMVCILKHLSVLQFVKNFHHGVQNLVCDMITCDPSMSVIQHCEKSLCDKNKINPYLFYMLGHSQCIQCCMYK